MRDSGLEQVLAECTEQVLEQMFFVRPLSEPGDTSCCRSQSQMVVEINFAGEPSGHLTLSIATPAARSLAADFLAEEEPVLSEKQVGEVVCELANIICGSVLTRVESRTLFQLGSPRLISSPPPGEVGSAVQSLNLLSGNLTVAMRTESPICPAATKSVS